MSQASGQFEVSVLATAAPDPSTGFISIALNSQCALSGDYDAQIDYRLLSWPAPHGVNVGFATDTPDFAHAYGAFVFDPGNGTGISTGSPAPTTRSCRTHPPQERYESRGPGRH